MWNTATMIKMCGIWPARWHAYYNDEAWRSDKPWLKRVNAMTLLVLGQYCRAVRPDEGTAVWRWDCGGRFVPMGTAEADTRDDAVDIALIILPHFWWLFVFVFLIASWNLNNWWYSTAMIRTMFFLDWSRRHIRKLLSFFLNAPCWCLLKAKDLGEVVVITSALRL